MQPLPQTSEFSKNSEVCARLDAASPKDFHVLPAPGLQAQVRSGFTCTRTLGNRYRC
jgi:hypothetical protein